MLYVALEPHVRRRWPSSLISWGRLLAGQMRDPVVGRDLVVGILAGVFLTVASEVEAIGSGLDGEDTHFRRMSNVDFDESFGASRRDRRHPAGRCISVSLSLFFFFLFFLIRLVLRKEWLAVLVTILLFPIFWYSGITRCCIRLSNCVFCGIALMILIRFRTPRTCGGYSAWITFCTVSPLTTHLSAWYAEPTFFVFFVILAAAIFGFYTSTAGKTSVWRRRFARRLSRGRACFSDFLSSARSNSF